MLNEQSENVKVSLIVPMYCCEECVYPVLDNLCGQDYRNIEIICVVDGSPDNTLAFAEEYAEKDSRVRVFNCEHRGAGAARNFGMSKARGEYLMFPDADDEYAKNYVRKLLEAVENNHADMAVCHFTCVDYKTNTTFKYAGYECFFKPIEKPISSASITGGIRAISHMPQPKIFRKSFIEKNRLAFSETASLNDMFFVTAATICSESLVLVKDPLFTYRMNINPKSISTFRASHPKDRSTVYKQLYDFLKDTGRIDNYIADYCSKWASTFRGYTRYCHGPEFIEDAVRELAYEEPWCHMSDRELVKKAVLYCGVAKRKLKRIRNKLKDDSISPILRESLEGLCKAEALEIENYEEIRRLLSEKHGKTVAFHDSLITMRIAQIRAVGLIGALQIAYRKIVNHVL